MKIEGKLDRGHIAYFIVYFFMIVGFVMYANNFWNNYYCDAKYNQYYYYAPIKEAKSWYTDADKYFQWSIYFDNTSFDGNYHPEVFNETQFNNTRYLICKPGNWKNVTTR